MAFNVAAGVAGPPAGRAWGLKLRSGTPAPCLLPRALQVNEFGQCPRQLFKQPHPPRLVCPPPPAWGEQPAPSGPASTLAGAPGGSSGALGALGGSSAALAQQGGPAGADGAGQALSLALVSTLVAAGAPPLYRFAWGMHPC